MPPRRSAHRPSALAASALAIALALLLAACSSGGSSGASTTGPDAGRSTTSTSQATSTTAIPAARQVEVHEPPGLQPGRPAPLLILLHGYGADGKLQAAYLDLQAVTDAHGMLFAHPDGTPNTIGKRYWNATDACCAPDKGAPDDAAYIEALIEQIRADHDVDPRRIYLMGHSNGGFMAYRMACDHADTIAAIVSLEAATYDDPKACQPSEPVAVLEVHGTGDETIPYDGGDIGGHPYPSAPDTVATWARYDGCDAEPAKAVDLAFPVVSDLPQATSTRYQGCDAGGAAELWTQPKGSHIPAWAPGFVDQAVRWLLAHPKPA